MLIAVEDFYDCSSSGGGSSWWWWTFSERSAASLVIVLRKVYCMLPFTSRKGREGRAEVEEEKLKAKEGEK